MTITANDLLLLLAKRHFKDVFITECKSGSTYAANHKRLDAWAMKKSWVSPFTFGYEIKVNRNDFLKDDKWPAYLKLCNYFYFVVPHGIVSLEEIPESCGLLICSKNGTMLFTKKKAPFREVIIPESLYRYILMWRVHIIRECNSTSQLEYWKHWLAEKKEKQEIGYQVRGKIRELYNNLQKQVRHMENKIEIYDEFKRALINIGFDPDDYSTWYVEDRLRQALQGVPPGIDSQIERLIENLITVKGELTPTQKLPEAK